MIKKLSTIKDSFSVVIVLLETTAQSKMFEFSVVYTKIFKNFNS